MPAKLVDPRGQTWQHLDGFGIDAMHADIVFDELHAKIRVVDEIVRIAGISVGVAGSPDEDRLLGRATLCESRYGIPKISAQILCTVLVDDPGEANAEIYNIERPSAIRPINHVVDFRRPRIVGRT